MGKYINGNSYSVLWADKNQSLQMEGDGWKLITEEEKKLNPELQKLKDLLK